MKPLPPITLNWILILLVICITGLSWGALLPYAFDMSRSISREQSAKAVRNRAEFAGNDLVRALGREWERLYAAAQFVATEQNAGELRAQFSTITAANSDVAWIGFADTSGKIVVASNGVFEGEKVNERPWFRAGAEGPYVGDKHEAVLLAPHLKIEANEPVPLIDFAMPVMRNHARIGVIAMHVDWAWVRKLLETFDRNDGVDVILVSRTGTVLAGPSGLVGGKLTQQSVLAASQGVKVTRTEVWPDGVTYLVAVAPVPYRSDVPGFGWSMLARESATAAFAPVRAFTEWMLTLIGVGTILSLILSVVIARILSAPVKRLAAAAREMAHGRCTQPIPDERAYREAADLAGALIDLQSTVLGRTTVSEISPRKGRELTIA
jgi:hypothetical protein